MNAIPNLSGQMLPLDQAAARAAVIFNAIEDLCVPDHVYIAGSIRRGNKAATQDADMVCLPKDRDTLLARLDRCIVEGKLTKAINEKGASTWGPKQRKFSVDGFKVELYIANPHNFGYILWIRTGPNEANQMALSYRHQQDCQIGTDTGHLTRNGKRISIPDERTLFHVLRMDYIVPEARTEWIYRRQMRSQPIVPDSDLVFVDVPDVPVQRSMF